MHGILEAQGLQCDFSRRPGMSLCYSDIEKTRDRGSDCYLTHPNRCDDTDDLVLDAANRLDMDRKDFKAWLVSDKAWDFMDSFDGIDMEVSDFTAELEAFCE
jgi:hypothetical protein